MNNKKYALIGEPYTSLKRLVALRDFGDVKKGDNGGLVEGEHNLSHFDKCWVYDNALVGGNARVYNDAQVYNNAQVRGDARVRGKAEVYGKAKVYGNAKVGGDARVYDKAQVYGNALVFDNAWVYGSARVFGSAEVHGKARLTNKARVGKLEDVVYIGGWKYLITIAPRNIQIGCESWPDYQSFKQTYKQIAKENGIAKEEVKYVNRIIKSAAFLNSLKGSVYD